ncbi:MAG TPA: D-glucuronyl C5-epimerase family protein [Solirubrobacteraceae bacterium]|nr:D-glucuronyl C5-epimerase family protein [Solirubrobacteraceae bacterium]
MSARPTLQWRVLAPALAALAVLALAAGTPDHAAAGRTISSKASRLVTVTAALQSLQRSGQISQAAYLQYQQSFAAAKRSLGRLSGTRREELGAVLSNVEAMAAKGQLIVSRLPVVFTTVQRNREWWTTRYLPGADERVSFTGSRLVWEHYPGQGIEIQWLGTFGEANGYYLSHQTTALREVLDEAIALATHRAGGIAWEYLFQFDGGIPPWSSGLSQGTALQALSRAWSRTHETAYLDAAKEALGIFRTRPPAGVLEHRPAGSHYLEYTYAPGERILNGYIQSLVGLYEYAKLTGDPEGQALFEAGDANARTETPRYDTGAWSMYDQHSESDLSYHELLAEFLEHLCQKTQTGEPLATAKPPVPIAGDEVYCTTAKHFREYVKTPPLLSLLTSTLRTSQRAGVQVQLSKVAAVSMSISLGGKTVWSNAATVEGGKPRLLWVTPSKPGTYTVSLKARDLAGNTTSATGTIVVSKTPSAKHARTTSARGISALARTWRQQPQP